MRTTKCSSEYRFYLENIFSLLNFAPAIFDILVNNLYDDILQLMLNPVI